MTNRTKIFTESVAQLGVGKPELEALTSLFKVCLESALEDESNWALEKYDNDNAVDFDEDGVITDEDEEDASSLHDKMEIGVKDEPEDEEDGIEPASGEETFQPPAPVSTVGTTLANAYIQTAPKLLARNMCTPDKVETLYNFITWLLTKFKDYDYKSYLNTAADNASYDTERMDDMLYLVDTGSPVVQLLADLLSTFKESLKHATLTDDKSIFAVAREINDYISDTFNSSTIKNEPSDPNIVTGDKFYDVGTDIDAGDPNEKKENLGSDKEDTTKSPDKFDVDADMSIVDKAVEAFVKFTPTIGMDDSKAAAFNKPIDQNNKKAAKDMAKKRANLMREHQGNIVDSSVLNYNDDDDL